MTNIDHKPSDSKTSEEQSRPFLPPAHRTPFVVRQRDIALLTQRLKLAKQGEGVCMALRADSGMGKSRLAYELAYRTRKQDVNVVFVPCRGCGVDLQRPLLDLTRGILEVDEATPDTVQRDRIKETLQKLLLDDLSDFFLSWLGLASSQLENGLKSAELVAALVRVLAAHSENQRASLIIFDDLEFACDTLKEQLPALVENVRNMPVMILATFSTDIPEQLQDLFGDDVISLSELDFPDTLKLGSALAEADSLTVELGALVWKRTAGRPIFVVLLIEGLQEDKRIVIDEEENIADLVDKDKPVQHVRDYIYSRIKKMDSDVRTTILGGAVAGDGFDVKLVSYLMEQDDAGIVKHFDELIEKGWLEQSGVGLTATYRFTQSMVREIIYQRMQTEERVRMHRRIGDYLVSVTPDPEAEQLNLIAQHYIDAGAPELGIIAFEPHLEQAYEARKQIRVIELLRRGIDMASADHTLHERQVEMAEMLGDIYAAERDYEQAAKVYRDMAPTIGSLTLLAKLGLTQLVSDPERAMNTLAQVAPLISADHRNDLRWYTEAGIVWGLALTDQTYEAIRRSRDMLAHLGETSGFGSARTLMRGTLGMVLFYSGEKDEAHPHLESARAGWGARDDQDGVVLMNKVLIEMPRHEITKNWLHLAMEPLLSRAKNLVVDYSK